jgi:hypothetical protein
MRGGLSMSVVAWLVLAAVPRAATANDTEAVLAGGLLTFRKSDGIAMESEELTISAHKVEVAYVFRNTTAADITTRVAFPLAPYVSWEDEFPDSRDPWWGQFGHFTVAVDGKPVTFETTAKVDDNARDSSRTATVTHHWTQTFPAGRALSVKHTFTPQGGFIYDFQYADKRLETVARDYCIGAALIKAMKKRPGTIDQVHYILKTGANWKGPIGRFVLRIVKETSAQKSSVCLDGFRKADARTFVLEKTNFVPTHDLKVAFINYGD